MNGHNKASGNYRRRFLRHMASPQIVAVARSASVAGSGTAWAAATAPAALPALPCDNAAASPAVAVVALLFPEVMLLMSDRTSDEV